LVLGDSARRLTPTPYRRRTTAIVAAVLNDNR
jgi:hypothetical protein